MTDDTIFIADANFFIEGNTVVQAPHKIYTTQDALDEVRDRRSAQRLDLVKMTHEVIAKEPSNESFEVVVKTATDSGNVVLLSRTDMRLIALALDFQPEDAPEEETEPEKPGFDQWITAENYGKLEAAPVILCTADTTMQCVAMILGIRVVSPTGQKVAEVKRWLLRCAACGAETLDASKEFCPECGQHELVRYALVMRDGKETELPLPKRFEPSMRGKRYSIPSRREGRHARPLVLSEDMLAEETRKFIWSGGKRHMQTQNEGGAFFEPRKKPRAPPVYGYGNVNPNVPHKQLGKKKKRNRK